MAKYVVTYTPDGKVKKELTYKSESFSYTMIPNEFGKSGDNKVFEFQVQDKFPNEPDEVLEALEELSFADESEIEEHLRMLSKYERFGLDEKRMDGNLRYVVSELIKKEKMTYEEFAKVIGFQERDILQLIRNGIVSMELLDAICTFFKIEKTEWFLIYVRDSEGSVDNIDNHSAQTTSYFTQEIETTSFDREG